MQTFNSERAEPANRPAELKLLWRTPYIGRSSCNNLLSLATISQQLVTTTRTLITYTALEICQYTYIQQY